MNFNVKHRDGPARIGELSFKNKKIITPNLIFVNTKRFKAPQFADFLITNNDLKTTKPTLRFTESLTYANIKGLDLFSKKEDKKKKNNYSIINPNQELITDKLKNDPSIIFIIANASQLFQQPKKFVDFIISLREKIGYQKIIYLPAIGNPNNFAFLTYLGIDLFDSSYAIVAARNKMLLLPENQYHINNIKELPCSCPSCSSFKDKPSEMSFEIIVNHNYHVIFNEIKNVRNAISCGFLRNLIETRIKSSAHLTTILRYLDRNYYNFLEKRTPATSKKMVLATTKESLFRPEIKRFQNRLIYRYKKPESSKVLLLLPCSAKKPYSFSKSHKLFREQLFSSGNAFVFHELIITSPLGLVPRELELVYPASNYDIPVTGVWDEDEKKMIRSLLKEYLKKNSYDKIIMHLPREINEFLNDLIKEPVISCIDHPTSEKSLTNLLKILKKKAELYDKIRNQIRTRDEMECFASYQFGRKIAKGLMKKSIVKGKYPYQKIIQNNIQLGMTTLERGFISLTIQGAEKLFKSEEYWVEIYDDFKLKGSVFSPGVKNTDEQIRIGDEVVVIQKGKLQGVGVALMNGEEMKQSNHGEAVKIRHKI